MKYRLVEENYIRKMIFKSIFGTLIFIYFTSLCVSWIVTHPQRIGIKSTPSDYGLKYEDVSFRNPTDEIVLKGWWIPSHGEKTVIFSHGYGYNREQMPISTLELANTLHKEGYNILMYDFRNSGESEGDSTTIGTKEYTDVLAAITYTVEIKNSKDIALLGWSMGASSSIIASSKSQHVKAVVADSPFSDLRTYLVDSFSYWTKLPDFMGTVVSKIAMTINLEVEPDKVAPIEEMSEDKPVFLIHALDDPAIPVEESMKMEKANKNASLWTPKKGKHIRSYSHNKAEYEQKVKDFLNENL